MLDINQVAQDTDSLFQFYDASKWKRGGNFNHLFDVAFIHQARWYYSPLKPVFLRELPTLESLDQFKLVKVRDGAWGIIDFFFRYPRPLHSYSFLLVPSIFSNLVPLAWSENVILYSYQSDFFENVNDSNLFIFGNSYNVCGEHDSLIETLKKLIKTREFKKVYFAPLVSEMNWFNQQYGNLAADSVLLFQKCEELFTQRMEILNFEQLVSMGKRGDCFLNIDQKHFFISDDFISQMMRSKGMYVYGDTISPKDEISKLNSFRESPFHQVVLSRVNSNEVSNEIYEDLKLCGVSQGDVEKKYLMNDESTSEQPKLFLDSLAYYARNLIL